MPLERVADPVGARKPGFARASSSRALTDLAANTIGWTVDASTTDGRPGAIDVYVVCVNV